MKTLFTSLFIFIFALNSNITDAILSSDAKQLSAFFHTTVELDILGEEASYSKTQAEQVIKRFFFKLPCRNL